MFMALREDDRLQTLAEAFLAFGTVFVTLAVPLAFDGRWTSAAWAVEGAALIWAGLRQRRQLARGLGILLQFGGGIAFITDLPSPINQLPVLNSLYLGCILISLAALSSAWFIHHKTWAEEWELTLGHVLSYWGLIWWFGSGLHEHHVHVAEDLVYGVSLIFVTASCLTSHILQRRLGWSDLSWPPLLLLPAMVCFLLPEMPHHPLAQGGWFAWPAAFTVHWWLLYQREDEMPTLYRSLLHGGTVWFMTFLATWELGWQVHFFLGSTGSWLTISRGIVAITMLFAILSVNLPVWPWRKHEELYLGIVAVPLAAAVLFWTVLVSLGNTGDAWPFPWLPLFNPLDLAIAGALAALGLWIARLQKLPGLCEFVSVNRQVVQWLGAAVF